jgi:hypothetical protein
MAKIKKGRQKDKQRSTRHTHKVKYRVTRTSLKTGEKLYHKIKYLEKFSNKRLFKYLTDSFYLICTV